MSRCPFQAKCAHAHGPLHLRNRAESNLEFEKEVATKKPFDKLQARPSLSTFVPDGTTKRNYAVESSIEWSKSSLTVETFFLELDEMEDFLISSSKPLWQELQETAIEEGFACISPEKRSGNKGVAIQGFDAFMVATRIKDVLEPPSKHFFRKDHAYAPRIVDSIRELLQSPSGIGSMTDHSPFIRVEVLDDSKFRFLAINSGTQSAQDLVGRTIQKIDFWIRQSGYDKFTQCGCCFEQFNLDQGVKCQHDHFYCSKEEGSCFSSLIVSQINQIRSSEKGLVCPECGESYREKDVASNLPEEVWKRVKDAMVAKQVETESKKLALEFDQRLEARVQEVIKEYGNADPVLKLKAQTQAGEIRNTIMNLSCPHCGIAYASFVGCMAIGCESCTGHFCGYCHKGFQSGRGAHLHVRECLMNETANGSYHANAEQIERAQRRYKTVRLKKHLQPLKKALQNAIVVELTQDLQDVGIQPEALFAVGNLQDDIPPPVDE